MKTDISKLVGLLVIALVLLTACGVRTIRGSGNVVTDERDVSGFDSVILSGYGRVIITQGDEEALMVETDDNLMQYIETKVSGRTLEISFTEEKTIVDPSESIIFRLSVIDLTALATSGAGSFEIDALDADRLVVDVSGAGDIGIGSLNATDLVVIVNGAGNVELAGQVETQRIEVNGLGNYNAPDLRSQAASVDINGAGNVTMWVLGTLDVTISAAGNVEYYGSPTVTQDISGVGKVTSQGDK
jgi:hypothetical protein